MTKAECYEQMKQLSSAIKTIDTIDRADTVIRGLNLMFERHPKNRKDFIKYIEAAIDAAYPHIKSESSFEELGAYYKQLHEYAIMLRITRRIDSDSNILNIDI